MNTHSVIDTTADENAVSVAAINDSMLWGAMKDIKRTQGLPALLSMIEENIGILAVDAE